MGLANDTALCGSCAETFLEIGMDLYGDRAFYDFILSICEKLGVRSLRFEPDPSSRTKGVVVVNKDAYRVERILYWSVYPQCVTAKLEENAAI